MKLPIIILCSLFLGLFVTNPNEKEFTKFIEEKGSLAIKENICQSDSESILDQFKSQTCHLLTDASMEIVSNVIANNTTRHNYFIFSIYEINYTVYDIKVLALFNNFFLLNEEK